MEPWIPRPLTPGNRWQEELRNQAQSAPSGSKAPQKECAEGGYAAKHRSRQDHAAKAKPALTEEEKAARREKRRRAAAEAEVVDCTHCTAHSACMCGRVREIEAGCDCAGS